MHIPNYCCLVLVFILNRDGCIESPISLMIPNLALFVEQVKNRSIVLICVRKFTKPLLLFVAK